MNYYITLNTKKKMLKISILHPDKLFKAIIVFVFIQMQEIIDNVKLYTYGYCEYVNNHNIFIKKIPTMYYECSIPDEIFDTENYTLIDKNAHIPSHKQESDAKRVVNNTVHHARYFRVNERDKLFWTFYIFSNGLEMYSEMGMKNLIF